MLDCRLEPRFNFHGYECHRSRSCLETNRVRLAVQAKAPPAEKNDGADAFSRPYDVPSRAFPSKVRQGAEYVMPPAQSVRFVEGPTRVINDRHRVCVHGKQEEITRFFLAKPMRTYLTGLRRLAVQVRK